jgi:hypothetical protein
MPGADELTESGYVICNLTSEDYPHILDLLRDEKPICLHYLDDPFRLLLSTSWELPEPVGESEAPWYAAVLSGIARGVGVRPLCSSVEPTPRPVAAVIAACTARVRHAVGHHANVGVGAPDAL